MSSFQTRTPNASGSRPTGAKPPRPELKPGDILPCVKINMHGEVVDLKQYFNDRTGVIFGAPGAFTPTCTKEHVPGIRDAADEIRRHVDFVGCVLVNDPYVVKAWAKKLQISGQLTFIADTNAKFVSALGLTQNLSNLGMGIRPRRFAIIVGPRAVVKWVGFDKDAYATEVLRQLPIHLRAPWKSFLVGVGGEADEFGDACKERVESMKEFFTGNQQGFSAEEDWQLVITGSCHDEVSPTKENVMNGMRWLVEGAQAGDSLLFYFCGRGMRVTTEDDTEEDTLLPADWRTAGGIPASFIYEALVQQLPEKCRLTIVMDTHGGGHVLRLPFAMRATANGLETTPDRVWEEEEVSRQLACEESNETPDTDRIERLKAIVEGKEMDHITKAEIKSAVKGEVLVFAVGGTTVKQAVALEEIEELPEVPMSRAGLCGAGMMKSFGRAMKFGPAMQQARDLIADAEEGAEFHVGSSRDISPEKEFSTVDPL